MILGNLIIFSCVLSQTTEHLRNKQIVLLIKMGARSMYTPILVLILILTLPNTSKANKIMYILLS